MQIWPILLCAAYNRRTLTYGELGGLIGMPAHTLAQTLDRITKYCDRNELPPLSVVVINQQKGEPGPGHPTIKDFEKDLKAVFDYKWFARPPIQMSDLEEYV
jgi:hypothetical protein